MKNVRIQHASTSAGATAEQWRRALETLPEASLQKLKHDDDSDVVAGRLLDRDVVIKRIALGPALGWRGLKHALRLSRSWRQLRGSAALDKASVPAGKCLLIGTAELDSTRCEFLVMERLPGEHALQHAADGHLSVQQERAVSAAIGQGLAAMLDAGLTNRDHKPSNLLVTHVTPDGSDAHVAVVDTVAIRKIRGDQKQAALARMLSLLIIEPLGCGVPVRLATRRRVIRGVLQATWDRGQDPDSHGVDFAEWERSSARALWAEIDQIVKNHPIGPPKVDPLKPRPITQPGSTPSRR